MTNKKTFGIIAREHIFIFSTETPSLDFNSNKFSDFY